MVPKSIGELVQWWREVKVGKPGRFIWNTIPFAIFSTIWKVRNEIKFEGTQHNWEYVKDQCILRAIVWAKCYSKLSMYSINDLRSEERRVGKECRL